MKKDFANLCNNKNKLNSTSYINIYDRKQKVNTEDELFPYAKMFDIKTNLIESHDRLIEFVDKHLNDIFYLEGSQRIDVTNKIAHEI